MYNVVYSMTLQKLLHILFLIKPNILLTLDPAITLLGVYLKELKTVSIQKPACRGL